MLAFSIDYYGMIFRATQSVELFCAYDLKQEQKEKEKKAKAEQKDLQEAQKEMGIENNASNKNMIVAALLFILILGCGIILKHKKTKASK